MMVLRAATIAAMAFAMATPVLAQSVKAGEQDFSGFGPGFDTGDLAPGYELPGAFPDSPEREQVTPFGEEPAANTGEQDAPINVVGGQTETFERGLIGDALSGVKSSIFGAIRSRSEQ